MTSSEDIEKIKKELADGFNHENPKDEGTATIDGEKSEFEINDIKREEILSELGNSEEQQNEAAYINSKNGNGNGETCKKTNQDSKEEGSKKQTHFVQKHTEPDLIAEAVIVGGRPYFAVARSTPDNEVQITLEESISYTDNSVFRSFELASYMNKPYTFQSKADFESCVTRARGETLERLFRKLKAIWSKYIDADDFHISICAADTIFTYYQDKIGMTHYLFFVGGNDSGKSNNLLVLNHLAYRNFTSTGMTVANVYQFLEAMRKDKGHYVMMKRIR